MNPMLESFVDMEIDDCVEMILITPPECKVFPKDLKLRYRELALRMGCEVRLADIRSVIETWVKKEMRKKNVSFLRIRA